MTDLRATLETYLDAGRLPGAVALIARRDQVDVTTVGSATIGGAPMARDSIFRIASITKPITAAAVMLLVDDGRLALNDPVERWLPELADRTVVRTPGSALDDTVPARRPITVTDLLTATAGYGFASDFTLPAVQRLFDVQKDGRHPLAFPEPDAWMAELSKIPLLYHPGEAWLYDTCSTLQGILIGRVAGQSLPDFMGEHMFEPLGMYDTAFEVPAAQSDRFTSYYQANAAGTLELVDGSDGQWSALPPFPLGNGGLASTADDWPAFGRILLADGATPDGRRVLSAEAVKLMTGDHATPARRESGALFLDGQGWGFGGGVDTEVLDPWNVVGRYDWVGGTGTSAHIIPSTGTVAILLTQVAADSPVPPGWMRDFWQHTADPR